MKAAVAKTTRVWRQSVTVALSTLVLGCATTEEAAPTPASGKAPEAPVVLTEDGRQYLKNVFLFTCAGEYLPYPGGEGPPVEPRTEEEWSQREDELAACRQKVVAEYTTLDAVESMTWNGREHTMREAEMQAIVRRGGGFLEDFVSDLLEGERMREGGADSARHLAGGR